MIPPFLISILPFLGSFFLLLGYSMQDGVFQAMRATMGAVGHRIRHVGVQLPPMPNGNPDAGEHAERYLAEYLGRLDVSVYWGTAQQFCAELSDRLERAQW